MISEETLIERFEKKILPCFCKYVYNMYLQVDEKQIKGELFTIIRRYLPSEASDSSGITKDNIGEITINEYGIIKHISFKKGGSRSLRNGELVNSLNKIINICNFDYQLEPIKGKINQVLDDINYYYFKK